MSLRWDLFAKTASTDGSKRGQRRRWARGAIGSNPDKSSQLLYRAEAVRPVTLAGRGRKIGFGVRRCDSVRRNDRVGALGMGIGHRHWDATTT